VERGQKLQSMIDQLVSNYSITNPERSVPGLVSLYKEISALKDDYWRTQKLKEVLQLIEACSGLWLDATTSTPYAVQGDSLRFNFTMINRLLPAVTLKSVSVEGFDTAYNQQLATNRNKVFSKTLVVAPNKPITQPYWLEKEMSTGSFNVNDPLLIGNPESKPAYEASFTLNIDGQDIVITHSVKYRFTDPVKGELYQPLTVLPAVTAQFEPEVVLLNTNTPKLFEAITRKQSKTALPIKPSLVNNRECRHQTPAFRQWHVCI
jgi:hypothetical protein